MKTKIITAIKLLFAGVLAMIVASLLMSALYGCTENSYHESNKIHVGNILP